MPWTAWICCLGRKAPVQDAESSPQDTQSATVPEDIVVQRALVQARALLEKAERLLPTVESEEREELGDMIEPLRQAIAAAQLADIETLSNELAETLFYLEDT